MKDEGNTGVEKERIEKDAIQYEDRNPYDAIHSAYFMGAITEYRRNAALIAALKELKEEYELFKKGIARGSELYAHLKFDDQPFTPYQLCLQSLKELIPMCERWNRLNIKDQEWMERKSTIERAKTLIEPKPLERSAQEQPADRSNNSENF